MGRSALSAARRAPAHRRTGMVGAAAATAALLLGLSFADAGRGGGELVRNGRVAYTAQLDASNVYIMNADGSRQVLVHRDPGIAQWPVFSPDGTRIAFVSNRNGDRDLYVMGIDG